MGIFYMSFKVNQAAFLRFLTRQTRIESNLKENLDVLQLNYGHRAVAARYKVDVHPEGTPPPKVTSNAAVSNRVSGAARPQV
jgi:hypothetical protein